MSIKSVDCLSPCHNSYASFDRMYAHYVPRFSHKPLFSFSQSNFWIYRIAVRIVEKVAQNRTHIFVFSLMSFIIFSLTYFKLYLLHYIVGYCDVIIMASRRCAFRILYPYVFCIETPQMSHIRRYARVDQNIDINRHKSQCCFMFFLSLIIRIRY